MEHLKISGKNEVISRVGWTKQTPLRFDGVGAVEHGLSLGAGDLEGIYFTLHECTFKGCPMEVP